MFLDHTGDGPSASILAFVGSIAVIAGPLMDTIGAKKTMFASAFIILPIIWIYFRLKKEKHK